MGWNYETATHFLRVIFAGVFDRYPGLKVILEHLGKTLLFYLG
ncbi:amidohydrolase family protein [Martelella soudanensis]|nr:MULTISPECIES: amidohydrolase family protein [unclassified Martelella]